MNERRISSADLSDDDLSLPSDIHLLLSEIENEPVPQKLLDLAVKLQETLRKRKQSPSEN